MGFSLYTPSNVEEALALLSQENMVPIAGGTNIMVYHNKGMRQYEKLMSLEQLSSFKTIDQQEQYIRIGSLVTFDQIEMDKQLPEKCRCLVQAAMEVGGPQIRNRATVGGNLVNASPSADSATALMALNAEVELISQRGTRRVQLTDFFKGVGTTVMEQDELLSYIYVPITQGKSSFIKVGKRNALAIAIANMAVNLHLEDGKVKDIAVAAGSVAKTVVRCSEAEQVLKGNVLDEALVRLAASKIKEDISPIDDVRATASYREKLCVNMFIEQVEKMSRGRA